MRFVLLCSKLEPDVDTSDECRTRGLPLLAPKLSRSCSVQQARIPPTAKMGVITIAKTIVYRYTVNLLGYLPSGIPEEPKSASLE